jgi:hemerythrin-like metal-binding protein
MFAHTHSITWNSKLEHGVPFMDGDHREMVELINAVYAACDRHEWNDAVRVAMLDLSIFTVQHFNREEEIMQALNYPGLAAHTKAHQKLIGYLDAISERILHDGPAAIDSLTVDFLHNWLVKHVNRADRKLALFCRHQENLIHTKPN